MFVKNRNASKSSLIITMVGYANDSDTLVSFLRLQEVEKGRETDSPFRII